MKVLSLKVILMFLLIFVYLKDENLSESDETEAEDEGAALIKPTSSTGKKSINWENGHLMQGCKSDIYT